MQPAELERLWRRFRATRDPGLREQLILQYAPLVKYVIGRTAVSLPGLLSNEDILSYGTIGLIQAVDRFDPTQGVKFETYAIRRIRGSIIDAIRSLHPLSRDANRRARELEQAYDRLTQQLGRIPEEQEVADYLGLNLADFRMVLVEASATFVSLETPLGDLGDGERLALIDQIADERTVDVAEQLDHQELLGLLVRAIEALPERDRLVINLYYYEELTLREISEVLGVSTSRVSQLHAAAVLKLRSLLRSARRPVGAHA